MRGRGGGARLNEERAVQCLCSKVWSCKTKRTEELVKNVLLHLKHNWFLLWDLTEVMSAGLGEQLKFGKRITAAISRFQEPIINRLFCELFSGNPADPDNAISMHLRDRSMLPEFTRLLDKNTETNQKVPPILRGD